MFISKAEKDNILVRLASLEMTVESWKNFVQRNWPNLQETPEAKLERKKQRQREYARRYYQKKKAEKNAANP